MLFCCRGSCLASLYAGAGPDSVSVSVGVVWHVLYALLGVKCFY